MIVNFGFQNIDYKIHIFTADYMKHTLQVKLYINRTLISSNIQITSTQYVINTHTL